MSFSSLGLSESLLKAISQQGYDKPSPIQAQAIPAILQGRDVMAAAQTGTGKTAGFALPILQILSEGQRARPNQARALILTPTRELAAQVGESVRNYGEHLSLSSAVVYGGVKINPQMMRLRRGADVLVATPGRLLDLYQQNAVRFQDLEVLVLDEADRMLDMGFIHDIKKILRALPEKRQNLMFSATFSSDIRNLAKGLVNDPVEISVSPRNSTSANVKQWIVPVDKSGKSALLKKLIKDNNWHQVLVFSKTKHGANRLVTQLDKAGISSCAIHGNKSQGARTRALSEFKSNRVQVLVATDIAARGLDIDQLPQVVNFDLPKVAEDYVHRIGRTGRAGAAGQAVSLVSADEFKELSGIEALIKKVLPRVEIEGFEPSHRVPESRDPVKSAKPKKPKKPKRNNQKSFGQKDGEQKSGAAKAGTLKVRTSRGGASTKGASARSASNSSARKSPGRRPAGRKPAASQSRTG